MEDLNMKVLIYSLLIVSFALLIVRADNVFTAISDLEPLLDTHKRVINDLENYVNNEEKRLLLLKNEIQRYKTEQELAMQDVPNYVGNPLNAFTLIKRLNTDLDDIENFILNASTWTNIYVWENQPFPTEKDLLGAAVTMSRLQDTYKLEVKDLAEGILNHVANSTPLSAHDCFHLGRALSNQNHYENSIAWMMEALRKFKEQPDTYHSLAEVDIYDYLSFAHYKLGQSEKAITWVVKLLKIDPENLRGRANLIMFSEKLNEKLEQIQNGTYVDPAPTTATPTERNPFFDTLCRGEVELAASITKSFYCHYEKSNHPFLKLAPIKAEQKYKDPDAFIFYDVISDDEIRAVQEMVKPKLHRSFVIDNETEMSKPSGDRISKIGWLEDRESPVVARISQRISDFTGLAVNNHTAEPLQVANYGIGGHYVPLHDMKLKDVKEFNKDPMGNRIASVLFYMSEVAQGGATVFTELGLSVFPIKNSALFWWNMFPSCEANLSTEHGACPVLLGSKWAANKWIRQVGQAFLRPCTLEYQPERRGPSKPLCVCHNIVELC